MPTYKITIDAQRSLPAGYDGPPEETRVFNRYVDAPTPHAARAYLRAAAATNGRGITDPSDGAWFDTWVITRARHTAVFDVVKVMGPSGRVTSRTRFYARRPANRCLRNTRARCEPGQSAHILPGK